MGSIILQLLTVIQYQSQQITWLILFISRFIPIRQWAFDDSHSPKYQRFKTDRLPIIIPFVKQDWMLWIEYYLLRYGKPLKPVQRRSGMTIPDNIVCPLCDAPHLFIYDNNGGNGQYQCKVCGQTFVDGSKVTTPIRLTCPYCGHVLSPVKDRKHFTIHKCINTKCSYYKHSLKKLPADLPAADKHKYKLHYLYREFTMDFFTMDLFSLPKNISSLKFRKQNAHIMSLCLTYHVNLSLSLRKTAQALNDIHGIDISHTMVANYARTAALVIKPFVDSYNYPVSSNVVADETYIKVRGAKGYVWLVMDALSRSIIGYQVSDNRGVGPCILAMRMALERLKKLPDKFKFIADGYSAYPLAAQQFSLREENPLTFDITQVIGLTNEDAVSREFRPFKQLVERLNRTFKASYRVTCGYDNYDGANYSLSLWVAYYNFLRPHRITVGDKPLNEIDLLSKSDNMPGKWQLLIYLGQQTILQMQTVASKPLCS